MYQSNVITKSEEKELINVIFKHEWNSQLSRRTQHYGYIYPYKKNANTNGSKRLIQTTPIPEEFKFLQERLSKFVDNVPFDQIIINEYTPGVGISPHIDDPNLFGNTVISISLNSPIIMDLTYNNQHIPIHLERRSALILQNDYRYSWKHGIKPRKSDIIPGFNKVLRGTRYSITLRSISS